MVRDFGLRFQPKDRLVVTLSDKQGLLNSYPLTRVITACFGRGGGPLILFILICLLCLFDCLPAMMCMLCFWARCDISRQVSPSGMSSFFSVNTGGWHSVVNNSYNLSQVDPTLHWIYYTLFLLCIIRNDSPTVSVTIYRHGHNLPNSSRVWETFFLQMRLFYHHETTFSPKDCENMYSMHVHSLGCIADRLSNTIHRQNLK